MNQEVIRPLDGEALRTRPSHIIAGEVRQEESLDLLIALNSGIPEFDWAIAGLRQWVRAGQADPERR